MSRLSRSNKRMVARVIIDGAEYEVCVGEVYPGTRCTVVALAAHGSKRVQVKVSDPRTGSDDFITARGRITGVRS